MTGPELAPHWGDDVDWAGLLLLIVPAATLPVPVSRLTQLVRNEIERDAALYDVVTVAFAPPPDQFEAVADWDRAVLASLVRGALTDGHYFAPRMVLTTVVAGESNADLLRALERLRQHEPLRRFRRIGFGAKVHFDPDRGRLAPTTIQSIAGSATRSMATYEERPDLAMGEKAFLAKVDQLIRQGLIRREDLVTPRQRAVAPDSRTAPSPSVPAVRSELRAATPPSGLSGSTARPQPAPPVLPSARRTALPAQAALPVAEPGRPRQAPVFHQADDMVIVDSRSALGRLRSPAPTDADTVDRLTANSAAVSLAYFVVVPDEEAGSRRTSRGLRKVALSLDELLATVAADALTGRPIRVATEVIAALDPLQKHGVLRPAGELAEGDLPGVPTDLFDHGRAVESLLNAAQRTAVAFKARAVDVLSLHFIFLSGVGLHAANTTAAVWNRLLAHARVTWVEIGPIRPADHHEPLDIAPSPYGFHLVSDRFDVAAVVREESAGLYRYELPPAEPEPQSETPDATAPPGRLNPRWRFGKLRRRSEEASEGADARSRGRDRRPGR